MMIRPYHDKFEGHVNQLDDYFFLKYDKHDQSMIFAFDQKVSQHKKDITKYKKIAEDAAGAVLKDDKVSSLQHQIQWFRHEAIQLDEVINRQTREIAKMQGKKRMIQGDRGFIRQQVKEAMKQNNEAKVALKRTTDTNKAIREFLEGNRGGKAVNKSIETYRRGLGESNDTY